MPIVIEEQITSRRGQIGPSAFTDLIYHAHGDTNDITIRNAVYAAAPATWDTQVKTAASIDPTELNDHWLVTVRYTATSDFLLVGQQRINGTFGGGTQRIFQSLATVARISAPGESAPDFKGAINVDENGPQGIDIGVKAFDFEITKCFSNDQITSAFMRNIFDLTFTTNNDVWGIFYVGEVIFGSTNYGQRPDGNWEFVFPFIARPNRFNVPIGDIVVPGPVLGSDFLWSLYQKRNVSGVPVGVPVAAYVDVVVESRSYASLPVDPPGFT